MTLAEEDLQRIEEMIEAALARQQSHMARLPPMDVELRERLIRFEESLKHQRELMAQQFKLTDERFHHVEQHFEQIDQRFEKVDKRFEQIDQRFEKVDKRFEQIDQRFEKVDKRFEQIDQRFEKVDKRFEQLELEVCGIHSEIKQIYTAVNRQTWRMISAIGLIVVLSRVVELFGN